LVFLIHTETMNVLETSQG